MKLELVEGVLAAIPEVPAVTPPALAAAPLGLASEEIDREILELPLLATATVASCDVRPPAAVALADAEFSWLLSAADTT
jgi:hypothetical protein